jgi:hypothetical protein
MWRNVRSALGTGNRTVTIPKQPLFPHPREAGAQVTTTWRIGQLADFVLEFEADLSPLLIREFEDRYEAFLAGIQLTQQILQLVEANPNAAMFVGSALLGAAIGTAITRDRTGGIVGLGLGLLLARIVQSKFAQTEGRYEHSWNPPTSLNFPYSFGTTTVLQR